LPNEENNSNRVFPFHLFCPSAFLDEKTRQRNILNLLALFFMIIILMSFITVLFFDIFGAEGDREEVVRVYVTMAAFFAGTILVLGLNFLDRTEVASWLLILLMIAGIGFSDPPHKVVEGRTLFVLALPIFMSGILIVPWACFVTAGLAMAMVAILSVLSGVPVNPISMIVFLIFAFVSWIPTRGMHQALTGLRQSEEKLRQSEEWLSLVLETTPDAIVIIDRQGRLSMANRKAEETLGIDRGKIEEWSYNDPRFNISGPEGETFAEERLPVYRVLASGEPVYGVEHMIDRPDGSRITLSVNAAPLMREGQISYIVASLTDVSDRKRLEEQLQQAARMEAIGRLAGGVAHDFNNALTPITGISELVLMSLSPDHPLYNEIKEIKQSGERCARLTRQLLAFSRKQIMELKPLDLNQAVINMEKMLARTIGENIELTTSLAPDLSAIMADETQIDQIIINLAVNARDAMPRGGSLHIETANVLLEESDDKEELDMPAGDYVMLSVRDTGEGMDGNTCSRIFEPFYTTKGKVAGTGLGLATVHGIVKQLNGEIRVESEVGKGTVFRIYFPPADGSEVEEEAKEERPEETAARPGETVLVVEDDAGVRNVIVNGLNKSGYRVMEAASGEDALKFSAENIKKADLLVTDVVMTGISGKELSEKLTQVSPSLKTLYISGYTDNAIAHHGVLDDNVDLLQKPFTQRRLLIRVREALDGQ